MKETNKSLKLFLFLLTFLSLMVIKAWQKSMVLGWKRTVYFCQTILNTASFQFSSLGSLAIILLVFIFFSLGLVRILLLILASLRLKRTLFNKQVRLPKELIGLVKRLRLKSLVRVVEDRRPLAFCFGFFQPKIYLSTGLIDRMSNRELEAILRHERSHITNHDTTILTLFFIAQSFFLFFPFFSDLIGRIRLEKEINADKTVIREMGNKNILLASFKKLVNYPSFNFPFIKAITGADDLERRIKAILEEEEIVGLKLNPFRLRLSLVFIFILFIVIITPVKADQTKAKPVQRITFCLLGRDCFSHCNQHLSTILPDH